MPKKPSKTDYERYLNDHPIKSHPLYRTYVNSPKRRGESVWGRWLREIDLNAFNALFEKHVLKGQ